ncbi:dihydroorotate oxidase A [Fibrobacter sp. UWCM]|jgi:dihydroorotate dehydrogenase|uniref:dihydroorotate oxidase n=1 Tax=Fibrobacter sp. UWCM TaxID=1896208 RepID=UPI000915BD91|nr:dihydroorotate oxidase [Fibrobacter sp. UWCM]SHG91526.1 dihydroorotate oxidase A [Fibrobacter sp. UWCM]
MANDCINHEYYLRFSDKVLALIRKIFHKSPEFRHDSFKHVARFAPFIPFMGGRPDLSKPLRRVITFSDRSNSLYLGCPIILAAGANKTAERIRDYANVGFGGITVGTATRHFREGNTHRPRIGFLEEDRAIHNSMGLNNEGVEVIARRVDSQLVKAHKAGLCVGISVAETPGLSDPEEKLKDIVESFSIAYRAADYIEINVSCPNTGESRVDLDMSFSERIFTEIMNVRNSQTLRKAVYAKLSPDLSERHLISIMDMLVRTGVNGVVVGNTYPTAKMSELPMNAKYEDLTPLRADGDCGGMSGRPLFDNMVWNVKYIREHYPQMSVIACGGIDHGYKIYDLIKLGVDAVQCYSVVAFRWMAAHAMRNELYDALLNDGYKSLGEYDDRNPKKPMVRSV